MTEGIQEPVGAPWWIAVILGVASMLVGAMLIAAPAATTLLVIQILGIYWLVAGVLVLVRTFVGRSRLHWGWAIFQAGAGIVAGLLILNHPLWSAVLVPTVVVTLLGVLGLLHGAVDLVEAFRGAGLWRGILGGMSVLFGLILLASPLIVASWLPALLGWLGLLGGLLVTTGSFRTRDDVDWNQVPRV